MPRTIAIGGVSYPRAGVLRGEASLFNLPAVDSLLALRPSRVFQSDRKADQLWQKEIDEKPSGRSEKFMCDDVPQDEVHAKVSREHQQDAGFLLAVQPLAAFDKTVHRFR